MSPHVRVAVGTTLLLVTVCMVRAYPQSLNQTSTGSGESGRNQQHYEFGERHFRSNRNSGPTIDHLPASAQNIARNRQREIPGHGLSESQMHFVSRQHVSDIRRPLQQPQRNGHNSEPAKQTRHVQSQGVPNSHQNINQNTRKAQYRSIQPASEDLSRTNEDQNRIEKLHAIPVNNDHQIPAPVSRAYLSPPNIGGRVLDTRRFSEQLKMSPQALTTPHSSRGHTVVPVQRSNRTLDPEDFRRESYKPEKPPTAALSPGSQEGIVFPDQALAVPQLGEGGPKCATTKGLTFCENIEGYPTKHISALIQKEVNLYKSIFGTDVLQVAPEIANRISPDEELCKYNEHIAFPKVGQTKDEKWAWIANTDDFKQGVRVEVCENTGSDCQLATNWPMGYKTQCKQKHIYRRLLSVSGDGKPNTDEFLFPSCCVCSVIKTDKK